MTQSKEWDWEKVIEPIWLQPCEESYFYAERWKNSEKNSILDLGCGLGRHSILFAKKGFKVTAVDLSEFAINHLREWQEKEEVDILSRVSDMKKLPFHDSAFDCVWAYHVISHTDTNGFLEIIDEIKRVLKPNGEIYLTLCSKETWSFKEADFPRIDENTVFKTEGEAEKDIPHYYVDMDDIIRIFSDFEIERIRHIDDCYYGGSTRNSKHYYLTAKLIKDVKTLDYSEIIGKVVSGKIDRPLGSFHPTFQNMQYPVNYGYVDGIIAGDGSEQDIYLLGESEPLDAFEGTVIAVIHRFNDLEDKWVVSKDGTEYSDKKILDILDFQEKYFDVIIYR